MKAAIEWVETVQTSSTALLTGTERLYSTWAAGSEDMLTPFVRPNTPSLLLCDQPHLIY